MSKTPPRVLTIAGSDSGGGAGIQADLKTFTAHGCFGTSAITALTAQNTLKVESVYEVPSAFLRTQIEVVLEDIGADAVKIGMLGSVEIVLTVASCLKNFPEVPIVLDPVMVAKSGDSLLSPDAIASLKEVLIPMATIITPNLPEAEHLLGRQLKTKDSAELEQACRELLKLGSHAVLLKGGHFALDTCCDRLVSADRLRVIELTSPRIDTKNCHGTGCTLSAAIAANLAKGYDVLEAVSKAKDYITQALRSAADWDLGQGHGPVDHMVVTETRESSPASEPGPHQWHCR